MKLNKAVIYHYKLIGIKQGKLATVSGIDRGALFRMMENDDWNPEALTLKRIAKALSIKVSDIHLRAEDIQNENSNAN